MLAHRPWTDRSDVANMSAMARSPLPLALRLRNPPPVLVGRDAEAELIATRLRSHPLVVLHGPEGVGKLALATHVVHRRFKSRAPRCVYIRPEHDEPIARAVIRGLGELSLRRMAAEGEPTELAFELAEAAGVWVIVDGGEDPQWTLASLVAHYARSSRWVFVTSTPPGEALLEYAVEVPPLTAASLIALARAWQPAIGADEAAVAASAAKGSAWRLRRILAERLARGRDRDHDLAEAGPTGAVLDVLATLGTPVPAALLHATLPELAPEEIVELEDRGLVDTLHGGVVLHPAARTLLGVRRLASNVRAKLVGELVATGEPLALGEAIRIELEAGEIAAAERLISVHGARVFEAGSTGLARALLASTAPELARWRLRAAVELGEGDRLRAMAGQVHPEDRLVWAEGLMRAGLLDEAAEVARTSPDALGGNMLIARARGTQGEFTRGLEAIAALRALPGVTPALAAASTALAARLEALAGNARGARAELARLDRTGLDEMVQRSVLLAVASARHELGELAAADEALTELERRQGDDPLARFAGRRAALLRVAVLLDRGEHVAAGARLAMLGRATGRASLHGRFLGLLAAQRLLHHGEPAELERTLDEIAPAIGDSVYLQAWSAALTARARLRDPSLAPRTLPVDATGLWPEIARIHLARVRLRAHDPASEDLRDVPADAPFEAWIAARALAWERSLVAGDGARAHELALAAADRAHTEGFPLWEAEALEGVLDAAQLTRDARARATASARLAALATLLDAPRFAHDPAATFTLPLAELEVLAAGPTSPTTRRARWLLGDLGSGDAIDRALCEATARPRARTLAGRTSPWRAGWGLDLAARAVWRPDGSTIGFADKPQLWRLLEVLAASPAGLSKEALVVQTWGVDYHPLHHDKRLHNAIYKLRKLIESDPANPERIPTTEAGYRLGAEQPVRIALDEPAPDSTSDSTSAPTSA